MSTELKQVPSMIEEIVRRIVEAYAPERIILFGSYARGDADAHSDVDLLFIKETAQRQIDRWTELKRLLRDRGRGASVSPLVYTPKELQERLAIGDFFIRRVLDEGVVIYG